MLGQLEPVSSRPVFLPTHRFQTEVFKFSRIGILGINNVLQATRCASL